MAKIRGPLNTLYGIYRRSRRMARRVLVSLVPIRALREGRLLDRDKLALIDFACTRLRIKSFADLGGVWRVNGGYTFRALAKGDIERAYMVDLCVSDDVRRTGRDFPQLALVSGDFTAPEVAERVGPVDAVVLFDVLLHQGDPSWEDVLELYAPRTRCLLIFNPQWVRTGKTTRLLDLGHEDYVRSVPLGSQREMVRTIYEKMDEIEPETGKPHRDYFGIWQWGITDDDLTSKMDSLGFELKRYRNCGRFRSFASFENHSFAFCRKA